jgi:adenylate cyclase
VVSAGGGVVFDGRTLSPREAARELGVDYLLEGSVRKEESRLRVTVHLKDARSGTELWTMRAEEVLADVFALQDRLAERVAGAIEPLVQDVGIQKVFRQPVPNLDSYDLYLRALHLFRDSQRPEMLRAIELLERALTLDPTNPLVLGQSAICHRQVVDHDWAHDTAAFRRRGLDHAERAVAVAPHDSRSLALAAASLPGLQPDSERPLQLSDRAVALNPASAFAWLISGSVRLRLGHPDVAAEHLETALRLDPISTDGDFARMYLALARFEQRRFEEALALFRMTTKRLPISYAILASLNGHLGRFDAARTALSMFDALEAGPIEKFARLWFPGEAHRSMFQTGVDLAIAAGRTSMRIVTSA